MPELRMWIQLDKAIAKVLLRSMPMPQHASRSK
jgi:hypothetical protein